MIRVIYIKDIMRECTVLRVNHFLHRHSLWMENVRIAGGQVFITCCEEDRLPSLLGGKVFHVKQGEIL